MGTVALLVETKIDADVKPLREHLSNGDASVRALAARVTGTLNRQDFAPTLLDVLAREEDAETAGEQVRALLYTQGVPVLPQAMAAATRLGGPIRIIVAEWLARTQPRTFAATLPDLVRDLPEADAALLARIVLVGIRQTSSARDEILAAYAGAAPTLRGWRELLSTLGPDADALVLTKGLTSPAAGMREATVWFLVLDPRVSAATAASALHAAASTAPVQSPSTDSEWTLFGRELLARRSGKAAGMDGAAIIRQSAAANLIDVTPLSALPQLTGSERLSAREILPGDQRSGAKQVAPSGGKAAKSGLLPRTFSSPRPGFMSSLLLVLGCDVPNPRAFGAARIIYHPDGRPRAISVDSTTLPEKCVPFIRILAQLTVAAADQPVVPDESQWMFISMVKQVIDCADQGSSAEWRIRGAQQAGVGRLTKLKRTREVTPVYPQSAQRAGFSGVVILEATVTTTGCVANARVLRTVELPVDLAALQAVSQWQFEPTRPRHTGARDHDRDRELRVAVSVGLSLRPARPAVIGWARSCEVLRTATTNQLSTRIAPALHDRGRRGNGHSGSDN